MTIRFDFTDPRHKPVAQIALRDPGLRLTEGPGGKCGLRLFWLRCPDSGRLIMRWRKARP
ncbi:MAG: hypothetical protein ACXIVE_11115 [Salinarimonas sp.]